MQMQGKVMKDRNETLSDLSEVTDGTCGSKVLINAIILLKPNCLFDVCLLACNNEPSSVIASLARLKTK